MSHIPWVLVIPVLPSGTRWSTDSTTRVRIAWSWSLPAITTPVGFDLADDAVRSLRQYFGIDVEYVRAAVNREQIDELNLATDFNPAKSGGSRLKSFIQRTGGTETWECEALPPKYLQESIRESFRSVMDMDTYNAATDQERAATDEIFAVKQELAQVFGM